VPSIVINDYHVTCSDIFLIYCISLLSCLLLQQSVGTGMQHATFYNTTVYECKVSRIESRFASHKVFESFVYIAFVSVKFSCWRYQTACMGN